MGTNNQPDDAGEEDEEVVPNKEDTVLVVTNNQPDDVGVVDADVAIKIAKSSEGMDVQAQDTVKDLSVMTVEEGSEVNLRFYESGEDKDSNPSIEVVMNNLIDDFIEDTDSEDTVEDIFVFVDTYWKHNTGQSTYKKCISYGIRQLIEDKGIKLTQIMVDPILLKMYTIAGKRLPKARFVGRATPNMDICTGMQQEKMDTHVIWYSSNNIF